MRSTGCREVIRGAGKGSGDIPKKGVRLGASTPRGWDLLGVTFEGDVVMVIGVGVGTTGCIGDGGHGLYPIAVVGFADCPAGHPFPFPSSCSCSCASTPWVPGPLWSLVRAMMLGMKKAGYDH